MPDGSCSFLRRRLLAAAVKHHSQNNKKLVVVPTVNFSYPPIHRISYSSTFFKCHTLVHQTLKKKKKSFHMFSSETFFLNVGSSSRDNYLGKEAHIISKHIP